MQSAWSPCNFLLSSDDDGTDDGDTQSVTHTSLFSSNYTISNNIGPGRVLGNLYSYAGQNLERALGQVAHKAGFGPAATYEKIQILYQTKWRNDEKKSESLVYPKVTIIF